MSRPPIGCLCLFAMVILGSFAPFAQADRKPVKPTKEWSGAVDDTGKMKDAPTVITSVKGLEKLWGAWSIVEKAPTIDFANEMVVVVTTRGSRIHLSANLDEKGNLDVRGLATRDLRPGFRYVIAAINRKGIKTVNRKELPPE